ncbi:hypothetical protein [Pseudofrankia sp. BMG5.37]|uniref:hypothetical protein n=1 Tax=Pseudofrankia sp. BMG5.37 TaxID=3050035 RepID=UPI002895C0CD|nr:hypothetical protein [Pseudofrankia sp. BMG5.37]MDT3440472.1 hypothetical protein [Pseudofrankia sp. BMG5.37]
MVVLRARWVLLVPDEALTVQNGDRVEVSPEVTRTVLRTCYEQALSLVDVHSHPGAAVARLSGHDLRNALTTHGEFLSVIPASPPAFAASLVVAPADHQAVVAQALAELINLLPPRRAAADQILVDLAAPATSNLRAIADPACPVCGDHAALHDAGDRAGPPPARAARPLGQSSPRLCRDPTKERMRS